MELLKKNIHMNYQKAVAADRMTLSEDFNIPDKKPDAMNLIQKRGAIQILEVRSAEGQVQIKGILNVHILYVSEKEDHGLYRITGSFPFEERLVMPAAQAGDTVDVKTELEDLKVKLINSRKFSIQALISFQGILEELYDIQTGVELAGDTKVCVRTKEFTPLSLAVHKTDVLRVREEITLPSSKPNIGEILWEHVELRGTDVRVMDGELDIRGELFAFVLYEGDGEKAAREWMEVSLPFARKLECSGSSAGQIPDVDIRLGPVSLEVEPDHDGEERLIRTDAQLLLHIRLYEEESVKILEDFFSPEKEILPVRKEESYESLVTRNYSKCRTSERIRMKKDAPRMLQFCHSQGDVRIDEVKMTEQGVQVEGAVQVTLLYVTADDSVPFAILQGDVPFSHLIEAEGIKDTCRCNLNAGLEQLSAAMIDSEEIEVKASVSLHAFVADTHPYGFIVDVSEQEMDLRKIQEKPGIVGYLSQQGDTLWDIAREFGTTPKNLREWNHLESGELIPGTRLIILKSVPKIN